MAYYFSFVDLLGGVCEVVYPQKGLHTVVRFSHFLPFDGDSFDVSFFVAAQLHSLDIAQYVIVCFPPFSY